MSQTSDCALGRRHSQAGKSAPDFLTPETIGTLMQQNLQRKKHAHEQERARFTEALAAKQAEMEEALAAKQADMDAQAAAAQAYRTATVAAMAALEHRVKQLEDLAQLL